jgi:hypothetical protein
MMIFALSKQHEGEFSAEWPGKLQL